jgi:hypothetical protein
MNSTLPNFLKAFFWDQNLEALSWARHRDFIIRRLLHAGSWEALTWLRLELGDSALREWILARNGAGLNPRQLRFWEIVLELPGREVTGWVQAGRDRPWERRLSR